MPDNTFRKRLRLFAKSEDSTSVTVAVLGVTTLENGQEYTFVLPDEYPLDADLQTAAQASGKSAWDEDTLCEVLGLERRPANMPSVPPNQAVPAEVPSVNPEAVAAWESQLAAVPGQTFQNAPVTEVSPTPGPLPADPAHLPMFSQG
jgi:hypothetical protein